MENYSLQGVTQKIMADLCKLNPSTINKIVSNGEFEPIDKSVSRNIRYRIHDTRKILKKAPADFPTVNHKVLTFYNFKGGVGKTTLCYQVSTHLALLGYKVLVIDADPQGHLSTSLGFNTDENFLTLYDVVVGSVPIKEVIKPIFEGLDCVPSNLSMSRLETNISKLDLENNAIDVALAHVKQNYDFIIFDTNPTISYLNRNIVGASDCLCVVVETQAYALNGLKILLSDLEKFCEEQNNSLPELVIIPNKYEERTASSGEAMAVLRDFYGKYVIPNFAVRKSEELHNSGKVGLPLAFFCRSNSIALEDVRDVLWYLLDNFKDNFRGRGNREVR